MYQLHIVVLFLVAINRKHVEKNVNNHAQTGSHDTSYKTAKLKKPNLIKAVPKLTIIAVIAEKIAHLMALSGSALAY